MKFNHVEIVTKDLQAVKSFYHNLMGFELVADNESHCTLRIGQTLLSFYWTSEKPGVYHLAFSIANNQLEEAKEWIAARTPVLRNYENQELTSFPNWNAASLYFCDAEGNILELITRYDQQITHVGPFDTKDIIAVNEVGVVVQSPLELAGLLVDNYKLPYFSKGPKLPEFCVVGDEDGMFVIAQTGRRWFPTDIPAAALPLRVTLEHGGQTQQLVGFGEISVLRQEIQ